MLFDGMHGLGDNIYQRAFVREIKSRVYLCTSWPQLYKDLSNVYTVKPITRLRTQRKNIISRKETEWKAAPHVSKRKIRYGHNDLKYGGSILSAMSRCFNIKAKIFDLPKFEGPLIGEKYAVVRPVTVRAEWRNEARNPRVEYINEAALRMHELGYTIVSIADLQKNHEWCEELPYCDIAYNHGELDVEQMLSVVQKASIVIGGVGWIIPACAASGVNLITVLGGQGAHNAPEKITGVPMNIDKIRFIFPDNYCKCKDKLHKCNKEITNFKKKFDKALVSLCN